MEGGKKKNILILCTDDSGGAGIAMYKLLVGLRQIGFNVRMLVKNKSVKDDDVIVYNPELHQSLANKIFNRIRQKIRKPLKTDPAYSFFNPDERENYIHPTILLQQLDFVPHIILSTWISRFLNFKTVTDLAIATGANAYAATVDMSPLTGGCHYAWDCEGYKRDCQSCPAILDDSKKDRAAKNLRLKKAAIEKGNLRALAGSAWTINQVKASALFGHQTNVPAFAGLIDEATYNNKCRAVAKQVFEIPEEKKVIFAGAINPAEKRKGFKQFAEALRLLHQSLSEAEREKIVVAVVGKNAPGMQQLPFDVKKVDYIHDERLLSLLYQAADVFVCPSLDEAGPQMTLQAMACGTPVVCFRVGFGLDIVKDGYNGYSCPAPNSQSLAESISKVLIDEDNFRELQINGQATIKNVASLKALNKHFGNL